jgi:amidohydrolase
VNDDQTTASLRASLEAAQPGLIELSHRIHANPEVGYEETQAAAWLAERLEGAGFKVQRGVYDMPTAFAADIGEGPLHIAICAEYDALPMVGHACGHNVICTASLGAGMALAPLVDELGLRISVLGTPAEESGGGKISFVEGGYFDDVHAAMMVHPFPGPADKMFSPIIAVRQLDITYRGREAHASAYPHLGINAADAMVLAQVAIGLMRQQLLPTDRVHGFVTKGGEAANIIPAETSAQFMVRAPTRERMDEVVALVTRCFEAGALATGAELELVEQIAYDDMRHDLELGAIYQRNAESIGRTFDETEGTPYSTDMGNVSKVVPSIHPNIAIETHGAVNHQAEFAAACAMPSADQAIFDGALAMALTVVEIANDDRVRARLLG